MRARLKILIFVTCVTHITAQLLVLLLLNLKKLLKFTLSNKGKEATFGLVSPMAYTLNKGNQTKKHGLILIRLAHLA